MHKRFLLLLCCWYSLWATQPNAATRRWWLYTQALASDKMQGRDTGSPGYQAAEAYVIKRFQQAGLSPAGTQGYQQPVPLRSLRLHTPDSLVRLKRSTKVVELSWYRQITIALRAGLPQSIEGPLYFVGNSASLDATKVRGAVVVTLGAPRIRTNGAPAPMAIPDGAAASITIDNLAGPEPPIWPVPYAATMSLAGNEQTRQGAGSRSPAFRFNPAEAEELFTGSGHNYAELKKRFDTGQTLPNFDLGGVWQARLNVQEAEFTSDNILAVLPGSDPTLKNEYLVLSAHLDGYGIVEARHRDPIYNGAFDDAAYVALLMDLAQKLHESGTKLKRSLLFCIVTGEEKGLLGSRYFAAHPTIPKQQFVANLNLDQLRPIFPLHRLTVLALHESTLGETVQQVAQTMNIQVQADPEPERNLLRRSDHFSFMQIGVPAVNFVFGYQKGSKEEAVYRSWYAERYHSPADDLQQPWIPEAAAQFNQFYAALVQTVANQPERPQWSANSEFRKAK